jgi:hypothetical protein
MDTAIHPQKSGGGGPLTLTLLLILPSAMALFSSYAMLHRALYSVSALWFVYEVSFFLGVAGALISIGITVAEAARRRIPSALVFLMGVAAVAAVALLWYAAHIYRNPWTW